ncbi:hypothetical protein ADL28_34420 [Streptomyces violaceusniger]|uniref:Protein kinase domain-containing protein n=2 Tax=Streptomyces violaceusniger group TaxID=2839105 RepID=A0ABD5JHJ2_9ACTN|nr:hypothetical protein [Streptomyces violaceusniger]KUL46603.1 hypothetical protein ADL28_34420 [Streptomyces violaceusniger]MEE4586649.1 hypothetical protein [Streptomyces sp. DSM 41602]
MNGISFMASFIARGRLHGVGIESSIGEVDEALKADFIEVIDEEYGTLRRDYGFVELYFSGGPGEWVMTSGMIELHRLAADDHGMAAEWRRDTGVEFPEYCSWSELKGELSRTPGVPELDLRPQGGYLEYRAPETKVSVLVVDSEEGRDDCPGRGDVWSLSLG